MTTKFSVFIVIIFAVFLRFYNLSSVPPSPSLDEVSIGYNAYSILKTGADEYGTKFPLLLRAYDDWRPALYVYLVIPFVNIFDLTVTAVRLPSVIFSVLSVIATYFLALKIFNGWKYAQLLGIISALLLAISPWQIYLARLGHEANAGFSFFVFSLLFFFRNNIYLFFIFYALSFVSYQSEKIFLPIFFIALVFLFKNKFLDRKKEVFISLFIMGVLLYPFVKASFEPNALIRFQATNIFNANQEVFQKEALILADKVKENDLFGIVLHNRRVVAARIVIEGYISHFDPVWLFTNPLADRHKVPGLGLFYLWEAPFILLGIFWLVKARIDLKIKLLFLCWVIIAPLPGAITSDAPHAMRIYTLLPLPQIIAGLGLVQMYLFLQRHKIPKNITYGIFMLFITVSVIHFCYKYFIVFPKNQSSFFQYPLSQIIPFVIEHENNFSKVIISNRNDLYQSYMFFLFYSKYDPLQYQKQGGTVSGGYAEEHKIGKFVFRPITWDNEEKAISDLYVGNVTEFSNDVQPIFIGVLLNGEKSIYVVKGEK